MIPVKKFGDAPFQIVPPTSTSDAPFTYTSSNSGVATIEGDIITIKGVGETLITAHQAETTEYLEGQTSTTFTVIESSQDDPIVLETGDQLTYFMSTTATYGYIDNSMYITSDLIGASYKVLTGQNVQIKKV